MAPAEEQALFADAGLVRLPEGAHGGLMVAGVPLAAIADRFGTPTFVYNLDVVVARYHALDQAFGDLPHRICYAVKANGSLAVMQALAREGAGADLVSGGELARALAAGVPPARLVMSGVGKTAPELRDAVRAGVGFIHVESIEEIEALGAIAAEGERPVAVGIRVNPDVTADTHPAIATGHAGIKFGVPADQVLDAARRIGAHPSLRLASLGVHLGSQLLDLAPYREGVQRLLDVLHAIRRAGMGDDLVALDLGGGFGIRYGNESPLDPAALAAAVVPLVRPTGLTLYVEPGRFLVGPAGILLARVVHRKHAGGKDFTILDAGMNDLARPSLYGAYHHIVSDREHGPLARTDVVGPVCETGDLLGRDRMLPRLGPGALVAILGAGAYGFSMASNYNSRPRPAEVVVAGGRMGLAHPRETVQDLFRGESPAPLAPTPEDV